MVTVQERINLQEHIEDKRGKLEAEVFSYRQSKDGKVLLFWQNKQIMILKGKEAQKFLSKIEGLPAKEAQLVMAKITGNFKHGNERLAKTVSDN